MKKYGKVFVGLLTLVLIFGLWGCSKNFPTIEDIQDDVEELIFSEDEEVSSVEILEEKETKNGVIQVVLVTVVTDDRIGRYEYEIKYELDDGKWEIEDYECLSEEYEPLTGVDEETSDEDFLEMIGEAYYVENYALIEQECDLDEGEMTCVYQYTIVDGDSYDGEATISYVYDPDSGEWEVDEIDLNLEDAVVTENPTDSDIVEDVSGDNSDNNADALLTEEELAYLERAVTLAYENTGYSTFTALYGDDFCMEFMTDPGQEPYVVDVYFYDENDEECPLFELAFIESSNTALIDAEYANYAETADVLDYMFFSYESDNASGYEILVLYDYRGMMSMTKEERWNWLETMGYELISIDQADASGELSEEELYAYMERGAVLAYSNYGYEITTRLVGEDYIIRYLITSGDVPEGYGGMVDFYDSDGYSVVTFEYSFFYKGNEAAIEDGYASCLEICEEYNQEGWGDVANAVIYNSPSIDEYTMVVIYTVPIGNSDWTMEDAIEMCNQEGWPVIYAD